MGVNQKRMQTVGCAVIKLRQQRALQHCLQKAAGASCNANHVVNMSVAHMWDEVEVKQAWRPSPKYRIMRKNVRMPTLIARSTINISLADLSRKRQKMFQQYWLSQPSEVSGSKAHDLLPGIERSMPPSVNFKDTSQIVDTLSKVSSLTFMPMCDKASSN
eukprot:2660667-Pyramimonas_sp.AAC.1